MLHVNVHLNLVYFYPPHTYTHIAHGSIHLNHCVRLIMRDTKNHVRTHVSQQNSSVLRSIVFCLINNDNSHNNNISTKSLRDISSLPKCLEKQKVEWNSMNTMELLPPINSFGQVCWVRRKKYMKTIVTVVSIVCLFFELQWVL